MSAETRPAVPDRGRPAPSPAPPRRPPLTVLRPPSRGRGALLRAARSGAAAGRPGWQRRPRGSAPLLRAGSHVSPRHETRICRLPAAAEPGRCRAAPAPSARPSAARPGRPGPLPARTGAGRLTGQGQPRPGRRCPAEPGSGAGRAGGYAGAVARCAGPCHFQATRRP